MVKKRLGSFSKTTDQIEEAEIGNLLEGIEADESLSILVQDISGDNVISKKLETACKILNLYSSQEHIVSGPLIEPSLGFLNVYFTLLEARQGAAPGSDEMDLAMVICYTLYNICYYSVRERPYAPMAMVSNDFHVRLLLLIANDTQPATRRSILLFILLQLSYFPEAALKLKHADAVRILQDVMSKNILTDGNELVPIVIISLIAGRDEAQNITLNFSDYIAQVVDILQRVLQCKDSDPEYLASFSLRVLLGSCLALSISSNNKAMLVQTSILDHCLHTIRLYVSNARALYMNLRGNVGKELGGGGDDVESASLAIEVMCQLSLFFDGSAELVRYMTKDLGIIELLQQAINLPEHRQHRLGTETVNSARLLIRNLADGEKASMPATLAAPLLPNIQPTTTTAAAGRRQHVMLSYAWGAKKDLVTAFGNELRQRGYDVWRDEEGSEIVGPMGGDTDQRMAEAIESSFAVVVFVSMQYKASFNCQAEAKYARGLVKKGKLLVLYIMVSNDYTTVSQPECCDGWLGFMIGQDLWYPMFDASMIGSAVAAVAGVLGTNAIRTGTSDASLKGSAVVTLPVLVTSPVQSSSVPLVGSPTAPLHSTASLPATGSAAGSGAVINYDAVFAVIMDETKHANHDGLLAALDELGVTVAEDFGALQVDDIQSLLPFLKKVGQGKLRALLP